VISDINTGRKGDETIGFFTGTGNSLSVAKKIAGSLENCGRFLSQPSGIRLDLLSLMQTWWELYARFILPAFL
jgi:hypothetical protein